MSVDALVKQIAELPADERVELFDRLDEIYGTDDEQGEFIEIDDETRAMLEERLADHDANPGDVCKWEDVLAYVNRKK